MRNISIRKPRKEELPALVRVLNSDLALYRSVYSERYIRMMGAIGNYTLEDIKPGGRDINLVAVSGKDIAGCVSFYTKPNRVVWITSLAVLPKYRRRGLGMKLLAAVASRAKRSGAVALGAETQRKAYWVEKLNEKFGFKKLNWSTLRKKPWKGTLRKPPVKYTFVWGKLF